MLDVFIHINSKTMKNNTNQTISLQLHQNELTADSLLKFTASTMMVVMKKKKFDGAMSSPAAPGGGGW